jgi:phage gp29-like protein
MAPLEIIWKPEGGLWIPDKIEGKPQDWFVFSQENELRFLTRDNMVTGEEIPPYKFLNPVHHGSYNNPYGERCLSRCFWPVTFKKSGFKFWAIFVEKYGMPWVVGKVPRNTHGTERSALLSNLEDMVQDAVAVINDDEAIDITEPGGKTASSDVYSALVSLANREVSKAILGQTLSTELDQGGSFAAAKSHMEVRADLVDQDKRLVEKTMNQLLQWIVKLNFADTAPPVFAFFEEENLQNERAERDEKLKSQGVRFTKNYYIRTYNLEEDDFEIVEPETEPGLPGQTVSDGLFSEKKNENIDLTKNGYDINAPDVIAYDAANRSQDELSEMIRPVMEMIQNAESFEEIGEKLFSMYPNMESRRFQELLARAMNAGALTGYFSKPDPGE